MSGTSDTKYVTPKALKEYGDKTYVGVSPGMIIESGINLESKIKNALLLNDRQIDRSKVNDFWPHGGSFVYSPYGNTVIKSGSASLPEYKNYNGYADSHNPSLITYASGCFFIYNKHFLLNGHSGFLVNNVEYKIATLTNDASTVLHFVFTLDEMLYALCFDGADASRKNKYSIWRINNDSNNSMTQLLIFDPVSTGSNGESSNTSGTNLKSICYKVGNYFVIITNFGIHRFTLNFDNHQLIASSNWSSLKEKSSRICSDGTNNLWLFSCIDNNANLQIYRIDVNALIIYKVYEYIGPGTYAYHCVDKPTAVIDNHLYLFGLKDTAGFPIDVDITPLKNAITVTSTTKVDRNLGANFDKYDVVRASESTKAIVASEGIYYASNNTFIPMSTILLAHFDNYASSNIYKNVIFITIALDRYAIFTLSNNDTNHQIQPKSIITRRNDLPGRASASTIQVNIMVSTRYALLVYDLQSQKSYVYETNSLIRLPSSGGLCPYYPQPIQNLIAIYTRGDSSKDNNLYFNGFIDFRSASLFDYWTASTERYLITN